MGKRKHSSSPPQSSPLKKNLAPTPKYKLNKNKIKFLENFFKGDTEKYELDKQNLDKFIDDVKQRKINLKDINGTIIEIRKINNDTLKILLSLQPKEIFYNVSIEKFLKILYNIKGKQPIEILLFDSNTFDLKVLSQELLNKKIIRTNSSSGESYTSKLFIPDNKPSILSFRDIANDRRQITDDKLILNSLLHISYDDVNDKINEYIDIEIRYHKKLKNIEILKSLIQHIKQASLQITDDGNINIKEDITGFKLNPNNLQYDSGEISIILTTDDITEIKTKVKQKYDDIKNKYDKIRMPPPPAKKKK